jgi:hypothetical protein
MASTYYQLATARLLSGLAIAEVSDANMNSLGALADSEVEAITAQKYSSTQVTEYYSIYPPVRVDSIKRNRILLKHYPIISIDAFTLLDTSNNAYATLDTLSSTEIGTNYIYNSADYYCDPLTGIIELFTYTFDLVPRRAKIQYTYGYSSIPTVITELSSLITAQMAWANFLGASFDRTQKYSVPEQSFDKGDFKDRASATLSNLADRKKELIAMVGSKFSSQIGITSGGSF